MPESSIKKNNNINQTPNGFKQTDIGLIPEDWELSQLSEATEIIMGQSPPSSTYNKNGDGLPFYQGKTDFGSIYPTHRMWCTSATKIAQKNDILISVRAPVGPTNLAYERCGIGRGLSVIRANRNHYLFLYFYLKKIEKEIERLGTGSTFKAINKSQLHNVKIPLPQLSEQKKIAHVLSKIQGAIETQEQIIKTTQELKKALMQKLFTEGLNGEPHKHTEIGLIPESWDIVSVSELFETQQGKQLSARTKEGNNQRQFLRTSNVFWGRLDLSKLDAMNFAEKEETKLKLNNNDILLCEGGEIGRCLVLDRELPNVYYQNHLHRMRRKTESINPYFFTYWMYYSFILSPKYFGIGNVTTIPNLSSSRLNSMQIPLPKIEEQNQIVRYFNSLDEKTQLEEIRQDELKALFQSTLNKLMTGQIRVKDIEFKLEETLGKVPSTEEI